jgi:hypothetical protein
MRQKKEYFLFFLIYLLMFIFSASGAIAADATPEPPTLNLPNQLPNQLPDQIVGQWLYIGFDYQGEFHAPLDDNLELIFSFESNGIDDLSWHYKNSTGKCHRQGEYFIEDNILNDKIVWVDPENMNSCGVDPDMQMGRIARTPVQVQGDRLLMSLELSDQPLIYILQRIN